MISANSDKLKCSSNSDFTRPLSKSISGISEDFMSSIIRDTDPAPIPVFTAISSRGRPKSHNVKTLDLINDGICFKSYI